MELQKEGVKELLTTKECAAFLSVSVRTIYRMTKKGTLKRYKVSNLFFYKKSEIINDLKDAPIKAAA